eukprot:TRINITY_DN11566_c0_g1_i1.p2 TRINITY_DN11566_c0_g1~~TRINITY_DN11566_c0_g1_i1.p2  ORF type:complete len:112 (+),score=3.54 TRINITY_DN11566_c0_g1_i1:180-515(+)
MASVDNFAIGSCLHSCEIFLALSDRIVSMGRIVHLPYPKILQSKVCCCMYYSFSVSFFSCTKHGTLWKSCIGPGADAKTVWCLVLLYKSLLPSKLRAPFQMKVSPGTKMIV